MSGAGKILIQTTIGPSLPLEYNQILTQSTFSSYSLAPGDIQGCVSVAMDAVLKANPAQPIAAIMGKGSVKHPLDRITDMENPRFPQIPFEWMIVHNPGDWLVKKVRTWRYEACGGTVATYNIREDEYLEFLEEHDLIDPRMIMRDLERKARRHKKRRSGQVAGSQESRPSSKRQNLGSQSSATSQAGSGPASSVSSPEMMRPSSMSTFWPPPSLFPPPVMNTERPMLQPRSRRTASTSPATARVSSGLATMSIQSVVNESPVVERPQTPSARYAHTDPRYQQPPAGSPPATYPGTSSAYGPFAGGYAQSGRGSLQYPAGSAPQIPGSGYQGPGRAYQTPGYGQPVEAYGYTTYESQPSRPRGPPRVGFPLSQYDQRGEWNPPQPGQEQGPVAFRAPAQGSHRGGDARFVHAQYGSASTAPISSPSYHSTESYPGTNQSMTAASSGRGSYPATTHPVSTPSTGVDVFAYQIHEPGSSSGRGSTSLPYQETTAYIPPGWTDRYGMFHPWESGPGRGN